MTAYEVTAEMMAGLPTIRRSEVLKKPFRLAEICESIKRQLRIQVKANQGCRSSWPCFPNNQSYMQV